MNPTKKANPTKTMNSAAVEPNDGIEGILLVDKAVGKSSFAIVAMLRRHLKVKKIGHAGTLDPFATGVMVMLIGKKYTRLSDQFLTASKEYLAEIHFGVTTDSYDCDGKIIDTSTVVPSREDLESALKYFQGEIEQVPPMFSAKKQQGKKLYELARRGEVVERPAVKITLETELISYEYPKATVRVACSKGTYIRSIAYDLGIALGCGAHLTQLRRTRSGGYQIHECLDGALLDQPSIDKDLILARLIKTPISF